MSNEDKAEELLQNSQNNTRATSGDGASRQPLDAAVADAFRRLEAGDLNQNLTTRDERLAALLDALDETDRLEEIVDAASEELGKDDQDVSKSTAVALLTRIGLDVVASETLEDAKSGYQSFLASQAEDF